MLPALLYQMVYQNTLRACEVNFFCYGWFSFANKCAKNNEITPGSLEPRATRNFKPFNEYTRRCSTAGEGLICKLQRERLLSTYRIHPWLRTSPFCSLGRGVADSAGFYLDPDPTLFSPNENSFDMRVDIIDILLLKYCKKSSISYRCYTLMFRPDPDLTLF